MKISPQPVLGRVSLSRRAFCRTATGATLASLAFQVVPGRVWGANSRVTLAGIGTGGKGRSDISGSDGAGFQVVALCDVVDVRKARETGGRLKALVEVRDKYPQAKFYQDWRELLADRALDIDAVTVATTDHQHAPISAAAMRAGKHVYCQKPLTHSVWEARRLAQIARETGVKTQMGNQAHAQNHMRRVVELVRAGLLGAVNQVHAWTNRPIWPQGFDRYPDPEPVPPEIDWDLWIGPAQHVPYSSKIAPFAWRGYWNFGSGALGDMACHIMDMPYWALDLGAPVSVQAEAHGGNAISAPIWSTITYVFPKRGAMPELKFVWYDGQRTAKFDAATWKLVPGDANRPPASLLEGFDPGEQKGCESVMIGSKGRLYFNRGRDNWIVRPTSALDGCAWPPQSIPRARDQDPYKEWLDAIEGKIDQAQSHFGHAGPFTEMVLLGTLAQRAPGKRLLWDSEKLQVKNAPDLAPCIRREYRAGWSL